MTPYEFYVWSSLHTFGEGLVIGTALPLIPMILAYAIGDLHERGQRILCGLLGALAFGTLCCLFVPSEKALEVMFRGC